MRHPVLALADNLRRLRAARYLAASVVALGADIGSFMALLALAVAPVIASAASYSFGIVVHWLISSRKVFPDSVARRGPQRIRQKAKFVISALAGLGLTTLIVGIAHGLGIDPRIAKLIAVVASFFLTWLLRQQLVFGNRPPRLIGA